MTIPMTGFSLIFLSLILSASVTFAQNTATASPNSAPLQIITLQDGSQIKGHLVGVQGDNYIVDSGSMGQLLIKMTNVASITNPQLSAPAVPSQAPVAAVGFPSAPKGAGNLNENQQQIQQMQQQILKDPALMANIQNLAQDPSFMQLLQDPELMKAIMSYDMESVQKNPKVQALMSHPKMQEVLQETGQSLGVQQ